METDLRQNKWTDNEKELLLSNKLIPLTTVYFHKETENEIVTCFKNSDNTFLLIITNKGKSLISDIDGETERMEEKFKSLKDVLKYSTFKKLHGFIINKETKRICKEINDSYNDYCPKKNTETLK